MRRRLLSVAVTDELPVALRRFVPADWPGPAPAERATDAELLAASSDGTADESVAFMDRFRRRRQWQEAQLAWCADHGLTLGPGRIDWHRFRPLLRGPEAVPPDREGPR